MNAREGFVLGARLLAIYYLVQAVTGVVQQLVYMAGLEPGQESTRYLYLPHLAIPTVYVFAAIFLWFKSPRAAERMFVARQSQPLASSGEVIAKTLTRILALYLIIVGLGSLADFCVGFAFRKEGAYLNLLARPATWNDLAVSLVWLIAGLITYVGASRVVGAVLQIGDAVADELWRIKPEDDEPKAKP